jgi:hypothetical protein
VETEEGLAAALPQVADRPPDGYVYESAAPELIRGEEVAE